MEEIINRVVNSITLAIFGIILWSLLMLSISKLRKKEIKNFNVRALIIFITFFAIGLISDVTLIWLINKRNTIVDYEKIITFYARNHPAKLQSRKWA